MSSGFVGAGSSVVPVVVGSVLTGTLQKSPPGPYRFAAAAANARNAARVAGVRGGYTEQAPPSQLRPSIFAAHSGVP